MKLNPKESARFICKVAKHVSVDVSGVQNAAKAIFDELKSGKLDKANFSQNKFHPGKGDKRATDWIFLVDTLNFSFWSGGMNDNPGWTVNYNGQMFTGYFALCAAVNRAIQEDDVDMTDPKVYGSLSLEKVSHIFRSANSTEIPLKEKRLENMVEAAKVLLAKYDGSFINVIKAAEKSAINLLNLIVSDFPSFRDEHEYEGKIVCLYKRAQILVGDIWACYGGEGYGEFYDIDELTMFPDYRIPQTLLYYGALKYSDELEQFLLKDEELDCGDPREVEIRGGCIQAVEEIKSEVRKLLQQCSPPMDASMINSILIDHYLWDYRRAHKEALSKFYEDRANRKFDVTASLIIKNWIAICCIT